jgi:hypothetical protein
MEITELHLVSSFIIIFGLFIVWTGKVQIEFGITGPDSGSRTNFIASKKKDVKSTGARAIGVILASIGIALFFYMDKGNVLFTL